MNKNIKNFSFQGVSGAYSEIAGKNIYPNAESIPCKTFEEMFEVVRENKVDRAIVPIENSLAGRVADTQRLIPDSGLKIIGEYFLEIKHCLLASKNASIKSIKRVHSHEQALAQCRNNLITKKVSMIVAADTAGAAKEIAKLSYEYRTLGLGFANIGALLMIMGIPYDSWNDYYYSSLDEIDSKSKAIYKWLNNQIK